MRAGIRAAVAGALAELGVGLAPTVNVQRHVRASFMLVGAGQSGDLV